MSGTFFRVNIASTYLAMFVAASCVSAESEPSHGICMPGAVHRGFELVNQGRQWNAWSNRDRSIYLIGFVDGQSHTFVSIQNSFSGASRPPSERDIYVLRH
jgi:hypothetical protein